VGVAETPEMGGAISSVAGENRSRPLSRSVVGGARQSGNRGNGSLLRSVIFA